MIYTVFLAFSMSIDAFGIGISYGIRRIRLPFLSALCLGIETFLILQLILWLGHQLAFLLPVAFATTMGNVFLMLFGLWLCKQSLPKKQDDAPSILQQPSGFDKNASSILEVKEALLLGALLSMDSFGIGICVATAEMESSLLPILAAILQILFLTTGTWTGQHLQQSSQIKEAFWSMFSGGILIVIALIRMLTG